MMIMACCVICAGPLSGKHRIVCSGPCELIRKRETKAAWRKNNPEKFRLQQQRHNDRSKEYRRARSAFPGVKERKREADRRRRQRQRVILTAVMELGLIKMESVEC